MTISPPVSPFDLSSTALVIRVCAAVAVTAVFTLVARTVRGVSRSGAVAGAVVSLVLYVSAGMAAFVPLACLFVLAAAATRFGESEKRALSLAEAKHGRSSRQVIANVGIASIAAISFSYSRHPLALVAICAALAEAAADTVSSEYGEAVSATPRLITNWTPVPPGTDGGVSLPGTFAGIMAAILIALSCMAAGLISAVNTLVVVASAFFGTLLDSLLGASLERRGLLNNDTVNFLSTIAAALLGVLLARVLARF